jgi:N-acetylglucosamine kinase-like BadF-type ATPase
MSGVDRPADQEMVGKWIHEILPTTVPLAIHNDATVALSSGTGGKLYGIVVISGTGMIAYGYGNGETARAGGWGPLLGDYGSGHDIGTEVLRAVVRSKDGINPPTLLTQAVFNLIGIQKEDELLPWVFISY